MGAYEDFTDRIFDHAAWRNQAACRGTPITLWFQPRGDHRRALKAKAICATCPVIAECRQFGEHEGHGTWGGGTEFDRRGRGDPDLKRRAKKPIPHGTSSGYTWHRCRCWACCEANTNHQRNWKARKATG
jgi:WhiB family redox-sensing transcriptional regulator